MSKNGLSVFRTPNDMFARVDEMVNKVFSDVFGNDLEMAGSYPRLDIYDNGPEMLLEVAVPGLTKDNVSIEYSNGELTISGKSVEDKSRNHKMYKFKELHKSSFYRSMSIDERTFNVNAISADVVNGLLTVKLPRLDISQKEIKRIEIK